MANYFTFFINSMWARKTLNTSVIIVHYKGWTMDILCRLLSFLTVTWEKMELEKTIKQSLHILVFLGCFLFTLYQTILCIIKYDSFPKGTLSKLLPGDQVGKDNFPAITICSHRKMKNVTGFNEFILKKCHIKEG